MSEKRYTITEAASKTGYEPHVIRYYEKEFNLEIPRNKANHRYFTDKEIEKLYYIKSLQDKGLANTQIKLIIDTPQLLMDQKGSINISAADLLGNKNIDNNALEALLKSVREQIVAEIKEQIHIEYNEYKTSIEQLRQQIQELADEMGNREDKDEDVLICENAKLRMQIKQRVYEVVQLKEELNRERRNKKPLLKGIFKK